ncbi:MAG: amidase [Deltaproteobacteria bacterium]|nr:amidase [Deltaproteobacteria bacterium]
MTGQASTLVGLLAALRGGTLSAGQTVADALAAAKDAAWLNAFVMLHPERAIREAERVDAERDAGEDPGPLGGAPVALKDNIDEADTVCSAGCAAYRDRIPDTDATVVTRLRAAGAVVVGRTNMHELADGVTSENLHYGPVHNPHRRGFHPGGSSGGSAAAVAAGIVPAALGTDTGGSVRIPASLCGVVGFKPTLLRIPTDGIVPLSTTLDHVGVLARTVRDAAALTAVLTEGAVEVPDAAWSVPHAGLRVGVIDFGLAADPGVAERFREALKILERLGWSVAEAEVPLAAEALGVMSAIYAPELARRHEARLRERPDGFSPELRADLERGLAQPPKRYLQALGRRAELMGQVDQAMEELDLLVSPTTPHPARPFGSPKPHPYLRYTCPFNLTGQPAISVPMGEVDGLPVGLQLVGRRNMEALVLRAAAAFETGTAGFDLRQAAP